MDMLFDSHAHYDDRQFDGDRDALLGSMPERGVRYAVNVGCDLESSAQGVRLAEQYPFLYCAVGVHPHESADAPEDMEERLAKLAAHPKVRAIGEVGLDFHYDLSPRDVQRAVFRRQVLLANELGMPVVVHDREAHGETLALLRELRPGGIVHCFSGSAEMAGEIVRLGMYVGFTGVVTFKNARRALEAAAVVPLDRLLIETDCPYMAPEPYRGRRCDSSMLPGVVAALASIKGVEPQALARAACENACRVFGIALEKTQ